MNIKFNIKHNDFSKEIIIKDTYLIGDFVKEALQTLNIMIYSIGEIKLKYIIENTEKIAKLGVDMSFMTVFDNEVLQSLSSNNHFNVEFIDRIRDESGNVIKSDLPDLYNSYVIYKQDEQMASSLQNRYETYNNLISRIDGTSSLQSSSESTTSTAPQVYYIPLNPTTLEPISETNNNSEINNENDDSEINNENDEVNENNDSEINNENDENVSLHQPVEAVINNIGSNINNFITNELTPLINNTDSFITNIANNPSTQETVQNNITSLFNEAINNSSSWRNTMATTRAETSGETLEETGGTIPQNGIFTYSRGFPISDSTGTNTNQTSSLVNLFQSIFNQQPYTTEEDVRITVNDEQLNQLKYKKYEDITDAFCSDNNIVKATECTVCLETFKDDDTVIITKCKHLYHKDCINKWLVDYSVKCPICKNNIIEGTPDIDDE